MSTDRIYDQREDLYASVHGWRRHDRDRRRAEVIKAALFEMGIEIGTSPAVHIADAIRLSDEANL